MKHGLYRQIEVAHSRLLIACMVVLLVPAISSCKKLNIFSKFSSKKAAETAPKPPPVKQEDEGANLKRVYERLATSFSVKDFNGLMSLFTPNSLAKKDMERDYAQLFKGDIGLSAKLLVFQKVNIENKTKTAKVKAVLEIKKIKGTLGFKDVKITEIDDLIKENGFWKIVKIGVTSREFLDSTGGLTASDQNNANSPKFQYDPIGKRDPFKAFLSLGPDENNQNSLLPNLPTAYDVDQYKVVGIVTGKAVNIVLVEDPLGRGFSIPLHGKIGRRGGWISEILPDRIIILEKSKDIFNNDKEESIIRWLVKPEEKGGGL